MPFMPHLLSIIVNAFLVIVIIWFVVLIISLFTLSRRRDITIPVKIFWSAVIFFAPVAGLIFYLIYGYGKKIHKP
jgi:hypothetical protein